MQKRSALTLIELLVVVSLVAMLSGVGFWSIGNIKAKQSLSISTENMITVVKRARIYARESKDNSAWGVRKVDNSFYALVSGNPEAALIKEQYRVFDPVTINTVDFDIWFDQGTGNTVSEEEIQLGLPDGAVSQIEISRSGVIGVR